MIAFLRHIREHDPYIEHIVLYRIVNGSMMLPDKRENTLAAYAVVFPLRNGAAVTVK